MVYTHICAKFKCGPPYGRRGWNLQQQATLALLPAQDCRLVILEDLGPPALLEAPEGLGLLAPLGEGRVRRRRYRTPLLHVLDLNHYRLGGVLAAGTGLRGARLRLLHIGSLALTWSFNLQMMNIPCQRRARMSGLK